MVLLPGKQEGVIISLDCAHGEFLTEDRVVISLKGGELYVLTLVADSMRSVRSFHFDKAAASVLTCSVSVIHGVCVCHLYVCLLGVFSLLSWPKL